MNTPQRSSFPKALAAFTIALAISVSAHAATKTWNNAGTTWSTGANWVGLAAPTNDLTTDTALFNSVSFGVTVPTTTAATSIAGITVGDGSTTTGPLTFTNTTSLTIGASGVTVAGNGSTGQVGQVNLGSNVILGASQTWTNNAYNSSNGTAALKVSGALTTAASLGPTTLTLAGSGTSGLFSTTAVNSYNIDLIGIIGQASGTTLSLVVNTSGLGVVSLNAANTFSGGLTVKSGVVQLSTATSAGSGTITLGDTGGSANAIIRGGSNTQTNAITVASGSSGALSIENTYNTNTIFSGAVSLNNNLTLVASGAGGGSITMSGGFTGTGNLTLSTAGTGTQTSLNLTTNPVNMTGTITNGGSGLGATNISIGIGPNVTGVIQNNANSKLTLSAANSYTGPTTVNLGTLQLNRATSSLSSSSNLVMGGGTFVSDNTGGLPRSASR